MKKIIGVSLLAAFIGGAAAIGGYKLLESNSMGNTISEKQNAYFANNPTRVGSTGAVDFVQAAAAVSPAVVHIKTTYAGKSSDETAGMGDMFDQLFGGRGQRMQSQPTAASGSGVTLSADGYIVTNNHVVEKADKIEVVLTDKRKFEAKVIGRDPNTDLALIKIEAKDLPFVKVGNSDNVQVGEWVLAVGFPLDLQTTVTAGIVSAKSRSIGIIGRSQQQQQGLTYDEYQQYKRTGKLPEAPVSQGIESFIQTDAAINPGNSGGALINTNGELIGINAAIASQTGYNEGYGFAIPVNLAKKVLDDFMKYGEVKRGYIGVSFRPIVSGDADSLKMNDLTGVYISSVVPGGAADVAGIKAGDVIKKVNGATIFDSPDLSEKVGRMNPGDKVALSVLRKGNVSNVSVTLKGEASLPKPTVAKNESSAYNVDALGATFTPAPQQTKARFGAKSGVIVSGITPGKAFSENEIPKGILIISVNGKPVNDGKDVETALSTSKKGMVSISGASSDGVFTFRFPID